MSEMTKMPMTVATEFKGDMCKLVDLLQQQVSQSVLFALCCMVYSGRYNMVHDKDVQKS